jgi:hypothetical protein
MIAPFYSQYQLAWPFPFLDTLADIDTSADQAPWYVEGSIHTPPDKVCELLTAASYQMDFEFNSGAFNDFYGEDFPADHSFPGTVYAGTWLYNTDEGTSTVFNTNYQWSSQVKLFEGDIDPVDEYSTNFFRDGLAGLRYVRTARITDPADAEVPLHDWTISVLMTAQIPRPGLGTGGIPIWYVPFTIDPILSKFIYPIGGAPDLTRLSYRPLVGSTYLGLDDKGGEGEGGGGCFPKALISIISHYAA